VRTSQSPLLALILLSLCLLGSPIAEAALVAAFLMIATAIFSCRIKDFLLLCVLFLISDGVRNFTDISERKDLLNELTGNWQPITKVLWLDSMTNFITLDSIEITLPLVAGLFLMTFFIINFSIKKAFDVWLLGILVVCFLSSYYGYLKGNNGYSISVYISFPLLAFNWGTHLKGTFSNKLVTQFFKYSYFGLIACAVGIIQGHLIFLIMGVSGAMTCYYLIYGKYFRCLFVLLCSIFIAVNTTYTLFATHMLSLALSFLIVYRRKVFSPVSYRLACFLCLFSIFFLLHFAVSYHDIGYSIQSPFISGAFDKLALDRAPVWKGAYELITNSAQLISPSSRSYGISHTGFQREWSVGAHNVFLEIFRQIGWLGGLMISLLIIYFLFGLFKFLSYPHMVSQKLICISLISIFFTYGFTGHYLITGGVGIIYGALGGIVIKCLKKRNELIISAPRTVLLSGPLVR
jgi:hypothetical protein